MKYWLAVILLLFASIGSATPILQWDASNGAEGYNVYCGETPVVTSAATDAGNVTTYDIDTMVSAGVESECWVTAYAAGFAESADSNHIRFTPPAAVQTILVPGQPSSVTISWE